MKIRAFAVLTSIVLASVFVSGCVSAPTQTAKVKKETQPCTYVVAANKVWGGDGLCGLMAMEWSNEAMKQESRMNGFWGSGSGSE